jgi:tRNA(fMet)-specific endonuclease VapC
MPRTHLLDTSVYSQPIRKKMHAVVAARLPKLDQSQIAISAICEAEVLFGLKKNGSQQMRAIYDSILRGRFPILAVDADVAATYADLRADCERQGAPVQDMDLLIAATAKTHGLAVVTLNASDFARIPGVVVEDWSQPPQHTNKKESGSSGEEA